MPSPCLERIGEYTTSGATVNASLVSFYNAPTLGHGIAVSGSNLFVTNDGTNTIGEYTTAGATVNEDRILTTGRSPSRIRDRIRLDRYPALRDQTIRALVLVVSGQLRPHAL
jgi:hypothetical protein